MSNQEEEAKLNKQEKIQSNFNKQNLIIQTSKQQDSNSTYNIVVHPSLEQEVVQDSEQCDIQGLRLQLNNLQIRYNQLIQQNNTKNLESNQQQQDNPIIINNPIPQFNIINTRKTYSPHQRNASSGNMSPPYTKSMGFRQNDIEDKNQLNSHLSRLLDQLELNDLASTSSLNSTLSHKLKGSVIDSSPLNEKIISIKQNIDESHSNIKNKQNQTKNKIKQKFIQYKNQIKLLQEQNNEINNKYLQARLNLEKIIIENQQQNDNSENQSKQINNKQQELLGMLKAANQDENNLQIFVKGKAKHDQADDEFILLDNEHKETTLISQCTQTEDIKMIESNDDIIQLEDADQFQIIQNQLQDQSQQQANQQENLVFSANCENQSLEVIAIAVAQQSIVQLVSKVMEFLEQKTDQVLNTVASHNIEQQTSSKLQDIKYRQYKQQEMEILKKEIEQQIQEAMQKLLNTIQNLQIQKPEEISLIVEQSLNLQTLQLVLDQKIDQIFLNDLQDNLNQILTDQNELQNKILQDQLKQKEEEIILLNQQIENSNNQIESLTQYNNAFQVCQSCVVKDNYINEYQQRELQYEATLQSKKSEKIELQMMCNELKIKIENLQKSLDQELEHTYKLEQEHAECKQKIRDLYQQYEKTSQQVIEENQQLSSKINKIKQSMDNTSHRSMSSLNESPINNMVSLIKLKQIENKLNNENNNSIETKQIQQEQNELAQLQSQQFAHDSQVNQVAQSLNYNQTPHQILPQQNVNNNYQEQIVVDELFDIQADIDDVQIKQEQVFAGNAENSPNDQDQQQQQNENENNQQNQQQPFQQSEQNNEQQNKNSYSQTYPLVMEASTMTEEGAKNQAREDSDIQDNDKIIQYLKTQANQFQNQIKDNQQTIKTYSSLIQERDEEAIKQKRVCDEKEKIISNLQSQIGKLEQENTQLKEQYNVQDEQGNLESRKSISSTQKFVYLSFLQNKDEEIAQLKEQLRKLTAAQVEIIRESDIFREHENQEKLEPNQQQSKDNQNLQQNYQMLQNDQLLQSSTFPQNMEQQPQISDSNNEQVDDQKIGPKQIELILSAKQEDLQQRNDSGQSGDSKSNNKLITPQRLRLRQQSSRNKNSNDDQIQGSDLDLERYRNESIKIYTNFLKPFFYPLNKFFN